MSTTKNQRTTSEQELPAAAAAAAAADTPAGTSTAPGGSGGEQQQQPPIPQQSTGQRNGSSGGLGEKSPSSTTNSRSGRFGFNSRDNSDYKWQRARGVVGALEVISEPTFNYHEPLQPRIVPSREVVFKDALKVWDELQLHTSFIQACSHMPVGTCCCGLLQDNDTTIKESIQLLNDNWCKVCNKKLLERGFKIECFLWNWQNASGKAETNILLIRFYELSSYRLRRASHDSHDFNLEEEDEGGEDNTSPTKTPPPTRTMGKSSSGPSNRGMGKKNSSSSSGGGKPPNKRETKETAR